MCGQFVPRLTLVISAIDLLPSNDWLSHLPFQLTYTTRPARRAVSGHCHLAMRTLVSPARSLLSCRQPPIAHASMSPTTITSADAPTPARVRANVRARYAHAGNVSPDERANALPALSAALRGLVALPRDKKSGARAGVLAAVLALLVLRTKRRRRVSTLGSTPASADALLRERERIHDLTAAPRHVVIVTTASLPWMTGTAVNPALRAVALARDGHTVTLVVPWLESASEQRRVYGQGRTFRTRAEQGAEVRRWLSRQDAAGANVLVRFYDGVYSEEFGSILATGDLTALFADAPKAMRDVVVLEEPEHLTWHHAGRAWTDVFALAVGVVHTNYLEYAGKHGALGPLRAAFLRVLNMWVCSAHCHRVIRLSAAVQHLPGAVTENVHGVRDEFLTIGERGAKPFAKGAYFLGKVLWTKGYAELLALLEARHSAAVAHAALHSDTPPTPERFDLFGAGPDLDGVRDRVRGSRALRGVRVHGVVVDHASEYLRDYQVYVNASQSDVVCTATAEALAMGKSVVLLRHASNEFFARFRNTRFFETPAQFSEALSDALKSPPLPLSDGERAQLGWTAATTRFYDAVRIDAAPPYRPRVAKALAAAHRAACEALVASPANNAIRERYRRAAQDAADKKRVIATVIDGDASSAAVAS